MRRADRLLRLVQALRRHRGPVTAQRLAEELEVAKRTVYRDIADLQASRVPIEGEAGVGYVLRPGYDLPPLMFTIEEIEAIVLGARLTQDRGDAMLSKAAADVLAKVATVVPQSLQGAIERSALLVPARTAEEAAFGPNLPQLRQAIRDHAKLRITYSDEVGQASERIIWPLGMVFYTHVTLVCAWCELRQDYRVFRSDRIKVISFAGQRFNARNGALLQEFLSHDDRAKFRQMIG